MIFLPINEFLVVNVLFCSRLQEIIMNFAVGMLSSGCTILNFLQEPLTNTMRSSCNVTPIC